MEQKLQTWTLPPTQLHLPPNEVHVWRSKLDWPYPFIQQLKTTLSSDERERAQRFHRESDRTSFIAGRGILRMLLGRYLNTAPTQIRFSYSDRGKPFLVHRPMEFNLSHSQGLALYAIALNRRVGIDLESLRSLEYQQLAQRFFSDGEYGELCAFPLGQQQAAFFTYWTAKEAYLKATGEGLVGLSQVEIAQVPGTGDGLLRLLRPSDESSSWSLQVLDPGWGYAAALAVEGSAWRLRCYGFQEPTQT